MNQSQRALWATFDSIAKTMRAEFEIQREQLQHRGLTGRALEATLAADYLQSYLPRSVQLRRNVELVSTDGQISPKCDLVICDASTPPLRSAGNVEVVPIECVYAVVEVKPRLGVRELDDAWNKIRAIKAMPKTAWYPDNSVVRPSINIYGRSWPYLPVTGFVFAHESITLEGLANRLLGRAIRDNVPPSLCIDGVYSLNEGSLNWGDQTQGWSTAKPGQRTVRIVKPPYDRILPLMTLHIQSLMSMAHMPRFDFGAYIGNMGFGIEKHLRDESVFPSETALASPTETAPAESSQDG
jgi:hypothetical protein